MNRIMTVKASLSIIKLGNNRLMYVRTFRFFYPLIILLSHHQLSTASHHSSDGVYVSTSPILPFPKADPKEETTMKGKKGSSRIMGDTPIRDSVAAALEQRQTKKGARPLTLLKKGKKKNKYWSSMMTTRQDVPILIQNQLNMMMHLPIRRQDKMKVFCFGESCK